MTDKEKADLEENNAELSAEESKAEESTEKEDSEQEADVETAITDPSEDDSSETAEAEEDEPVQDELEEKYNAEHDKYLRLYADFENFRKRTVKEKAQIYSYAVVPLIEKLLKVLDSFDLAMASNKEEIASVNEGFALIAKQLKDALAAEGLENIPTKGEPFNPAMHHAVATGSDESLEDGIIMEEFMSGYKFKDKVIRAAMVKVNKLENTEKQQEE